MEAKAMRVGALFICLPNQGEGVRAARAIAAIIPEDHLTEDYIVPSVFDKRVVRAVAQAVAHAAYETGVARRRERETVTG